MVVAIMWLSGQATKTGPCYSPPAHQYIHATPVGTIQALNDDPNRDSTPTMTLRLQFIRPI